MLSARGLVNEPLDNRLSRLFDAGFNRFRDFYGDTLRASMRHRGGMLLFSVVELAEMLWLAGRVRQGFIPRVDSGMIFASVQYPEGIPFDELSKRQEALAALVQKHPAVEGLMSSAGQGGGGVTGGNIGRLVIRLTPRGTRKSADEVIDELRAITRKVSGVNATFQNPASINVGALASSSDYQLTLISGDFETQKTTTTENKKRLEALPQIEDVDSNLELRGPGGRGAREPRGAARRGGAAQ